MNYGFISGLGNSRCRVFPAVPRHSVPCGGQRSTMAEWRSLSSSCLRFPEGLQRPPKQDARKASGSLEMPLGGGSQFRKLRQRVLRAGKRGLCPTGLWNPGFLSFTPLPAPTRGKPSTVLKEGSSEAVFPAVRAPGQTGQHVLRAR